jgi:hypothetical protein
MVSSSALLYGTQESCLIDVIGRKGVRRPDFDPEKGFYN